MLKYSEFPDLNGQELSADKLNQDRKYNPIEFISHIMLLDTVSEVKILV